MKWKELPNFDAMRSTSARFPQFDPTAIQSFITLLFVANNLEQAFDAHLARHELSKGRFMILILLNKSETGSMSPAGLAESCAVTRATVTGLLDTLEAAELVRRDPDPIDRRGLVVTLTEKGRAHLNKMFPDHYGRIAAVMSPLNEVERETLIALLKKMSEKIPAMRDP